MAGCVVCGRAGWAGSKLGSHKICIYCHRGGYKFKRLGKGQYGVFAPNGKQIKTVKIRE